MSPLTNDPNDPKLKALDKLGMQEAYLVLSEEERAKGFVRPVWRAYIHVGKIICGDTSYQLEKDPGHGKVWACSDQPGHDWDHNDPDAWTTWMQVTPQQAAIGRVGGCGAITTMAREIAETYARNPSFYGGTYCARCRDHLPVGPNGEFLWVDDTGQELPIKVGE